MNVFGSYHPIVNFLYFVIIIVFSVVCMNPVCLLISLVSAFIYQVVLVGVMKSLKTLAFVLPMVIISALSNPLFNHRGETVLMYFKNGNPVTLESLAFGVAAGLMVCATILWFSCFNQIIKSDKIIYLFSKISSTFSMIFTMTLRFVPDFINRFFEIKKAQKGFFRDLSDKSLLKRMDDGKKILSSLMNWSLEGAIGTAISMKSRGYKTGKRSSFSIYKFTYKDFKVLITELILGTYIYFGFFINKIDFLYFPKIEYQPFSPVGVSIYLSFFILCLIPVILEVWEVFRWNVLK